MAHAVPSCITAPSQNVHVRTARYAWMYANGGYMVRGGCIQGVYRGYVQGVHVYTPLLPLLPFYMAQNRLFYRSVINGVINGVSVRCHCQCAVSRTVRGINSSLRINNK